MAQKLKCLSLARLSSLTLGNTLAYWVHSSVTKKMNCSEYDPRSLTYKDF
jgi:hypothetical protein